MALAVLAVLCKYARRQVPEPDENDWCTLDKVENRGCSALWTHMAEHYDKVEGAGMGVNIQDILTELKGKGVVDSGLSGRALGEQLAAAGYRVAQQRDPHYKLAVWVAPKQ